MTNPAGFKDTENILNHALVSLASGRKDTARRLILSILSKEPADEKLWLYLAATLPPEKSIQALQRVLLMNPQNKIALRNIAKLRKNPGLELDLADVLVLEEFDEDSLAVFGDEPATIPQNYARGKKGAPALARFGEEKQTLALFDNDATLSFKSQKKETRVELRSSKELAAPEAPKGPRVESQEPPIEVVEQKKNITPPPLAPEPANKTNLVEVPQQRAAVEKPVFEPSAPFRAEKEKPEPKPVFKAKSLINPAQYNPPAPAPRPGGDIWASAAARPVNPNFRVPQTRLRERPVRRNHRLERSRIAFTRFGIIMMFLMVILLGLYFYLTYLQ